MSQTKAQLVQPVGVFTGTGINISGVITATSFTGDGTGLTGVASTDNIITGTAATFNNTVNVNSSLNATRLNVTGVATATSFDGSLKSTGTPTLGLGVTINSSGIHVSGVATVGVLTGGTYYGDGSGLTGVGESIAPWNYNPDVNDTLATVDTGIGITFNKKIVAGSGTATLKIVNAGTAGTTIQSWGVSSCTFNTTQFTLGSLVSVLTVNETYQVDIPSGFIVDTGGTAYAGTAYTFASQPSENKLFSWGDNEFGRLGQNVGPSGLDGLSSPTQIPSTTWSSNSLNQDWYHDGWTVPLVKTDGTLWSWGRGQAGGNGQSNNTDYSSPVQIPGTTWTHSASCGYEGVTIARRTDGTLWSWGNNEKGELGQNNLTNYDSPKQIGSDTTWASGDYKISGGIYQAFAIKTDGTLWAWGYNEYGQLAQNDASTYSSPRQIPGTTWAKTFAGQSSTFGIKTDGTLWAWGNDAYGALAQNNEVRYSSPVQIPGTTWSQGSSGYSSVFGIKTDGTLWGWGENESDCLGLNTGHDTHKSSPVQIPGTTWSKVAAGRDHTVAIKTDGTLWSWGKNDEGNLGLNNGSVSGISSPTQIGSDTIWGAVVVTTDRTFAVINDQTP